MTSAARTMSQPEKSSKQPISFNKIPFETGGSCKGSEVQCIGNNYTCER